MSLSFIHRGLVFSQDVIVTVFIHSSGAYSRGQGAVDIVNGS